MVGPESDGEVGNAVTPALARSPAERGLAQHEYAVIKTEVAVQGAGVSRAVEMVEVLHIVPGREGGEYLDFPGSAGLLNQLAGHSVLAWATERVR